MRDPCSSHMFHGCAEERKPPAGLSMGGIRTEYFILAPKQTQIMTGYILLYISQNLNSANLRLFLRICRELFTARLGLCEYSHHVRGNFLRTNLFTKYSQHDTRNTFGKTCSLVGKGYFYSPVRVVALYFLEQYERGCNRGVSGILYCVID